MSGVFSWRFFLFLLPPSSTSDPTEGITVVISLQSGDHAMAESSVRAFGLGEAPIPHPRPHTQGITTSCRLLVGTIQITLDE